MTNSDTVRLLQECDAGAKMAVASIDEILERVSDRNMKELLQESKNHHEKLKDEICCALSEHGSQEKEPAPVARGMSWIKTNMKMSMDNSDATVADLIILGLHIGSK